MVAPETIQTPLPELEPSEVYAIGDVVRIKDSAYPDDTLWLLTMPAKDTPIGSEMGGLMIDEKGNPLAGDTGSILVANITEVVGPRRTLDQVIELSAKAFEAKYGDTIPHDQVVTMFTKQVKSLSEER